MHGPHPSVMVTLNCKYNTVYDIHRLNVASRFARAAVENLRDEHDLVRFEFIRDAPDIATFMVALRTELHMRIVMPAVVPHTETQRFLAMARFEVGETHLALPRILHGRWEPSASACASRRWRR